jgi:hypothetical protein
MSQTTDWLCILILTIEINTIKKTPIRHGSRFERILRGQKSNESNWRCLYYLTLAFVARQYRRYG